MKTVKGTCEKEMTERADAIIEVGKSLETVDVKALVADADSTQIHKSISERCKSVYKEHLPAISRHRAAFQKSFKAAVLNMRKQGC